MKEILIFILFFIFFICENKGQDFTEEPATIILTIEQLKSFGYSGGNAIRSKQPISSKRDALEFIKRVSNTNDPTLVSIKGDIDAFVRKLDDKENDKYAIIMIKHPLNLDRLFAFDSVKRCPIGRQYGTISLKKDNLSKLLEAIDSRVNSIEDDIKKDAMGNNTGAFISNNLTAAKVSVLNDLKVLKQKTIDEISALDKQMTELKSEYRRLSSEIAEEEKMETLTLDYNDEEWTDYLYDVDKVLFVLVGGAKDIQKMKLTVDNKPSTLQTSLNQVIQVATGLGIDIPQNVSSDCGITNFRLDDNIPVTFLLVKRKKIKAPATLELSIEEKDRKTAFDIHEKVRFDLKLGISASYMTRKNFSINQQNELTINVDDDKKEELKSNLIVLLEVIPWGRDIDRLEPIFSRNKEIKFFDWNRLGIVGGVKLSKDPLEALYGGFSYLLSKTVALNFGVSMQATPKDVANLPIGINASLDYLKENADKELKPQLFFGISFSPIFLGKSLGIVK